MGEFINYGSSGTNAPPGVGGKGFFGSTPPKAVTPPPTGATFMVVAANDTNPNLATGAAASWRDASGTWHVVDASALGARGSFGVTHVSGVWYMTTNAPGVLNALLGKTADGSPPAAMSAVVTNVPDHLTAIDGALGFKIATLFGNIVTAPANLSSFTINSANGPGSYVVLGVASDQDPPT